MTRNRANIDDLHEKKDTECPKLPRHPRKRMSRTRIYYVKAVQIPFFDKSHKSDEDDEAEDADEGTREAANPAAGDDNNVADKPQMQDE